VRTKNTSGTVVATETKIHEMKQNEAQETKKKKTEEEI